MHEILTFHVEDGSMERPFAGCGVHAHYCPLWIEIHLCLARSLKFSVHPLEEDSLTFVRELCVMYKVLT